MKSIGKKELASILNYVDEKREEKVIQAKLFIDKPLFSAACDKLAKLADEECFTFGAACVYRQSRKAYSYGIYIEKLERQLANAKTNFEALHNPEKIDFSWAVRFHGTNTTK